MNLVDEIEKVQIEKLSEVLVEGKDEKHLKEGVDVIKDRFKNREDIFNIGDLVRLQVKIVEGKRERLQRFEGYVIAMKGHGVTRTFKLRKVAFGVGVERTFPLYSPKLDSIELVRRGRIRRAKLYYLRDRKGKKANIKEKVATKR